VAELIVVDTGSTDGTYDIVKKYADKHEVFTECNDEEGRMADFAMARNRSYSHATQKWALWIDGDDVLENSHLLADVIDTYQHRADKGPFSIMLPYEYSHDEKGNPTLVHYRERLMTPITEFEWKSPVHEVACCKSHHDHVQDDRMRVIHYRDRSNKVKDPVRNLRILKRHYEKVGDSDIRGLYYLATEYGNNGDLENAIKHHLRYQEIAWWDDEKYYSAVKLVDHYLTINEYDKALEWAHNLPKIKDNWAESYLHICRVHYYYGHRGGSDERKHWEKCITFGQIALSLPPAVTVLFANPFEMGLDVHRYMNFAYNKIGKVKEALAACEKGLEFKSSDETLNYNARLYKSFISRQTIGNELDSLKKTVDLSDIGVHTVKDIIENPKDKIIYLRYAPEADHSSITDKINAVLKEHKIGSFDPVTPSIKHINTPIKMAVYVGTGVEEWTPESIKTTGIGGSETAVVEMTRRLAKKGYDITVYGSGPELDFEGVKYVHPDKWTNMSAHLAVSSRRPWMMDDEYGAKFKLGYIWTHDITAYEVTKFRYERIDYFLALSDWHRRFMLNYYQFINPTRIITTQNGLDLTRFEQQVDRDPYKLVYSSSPDRGLYKLLKAWDRIKSAVPQASLSVFYGFKNWEVAAGYRNNPRELSQISEIKNMLGKLESQNVSFKGRVDQRSLAREYLSAGVWSYPTWFTETSCITAMEAQAAGLKIVCPHVAALEETVADRGRILTGKYDDPEFLDQTVDRTIEALKSTDETERIRNQEYARKNFSWDKVADDWDAMFRSHLSDLDTHSLRIS